MGAIKLDHYSADEVRFAELGRAIGAPARIVILRYLSQNDRVTGPELKKILKLKKPTIQQHIETLVQAGLICGSYNSENIFGWKLNKTNETELEHLNWAIHKTSL